MINLTVDDIRRSIDHVSLARGRDLFASGHVVGLTITSGGGLIKGSVVGSTGKLYRLEIDIEADTNGSVSIVGDCDCPVGINCKHVAAVLLAAVQQPRPVGSNFDLQIPSKAPAVKRDAPLTVKQELTYKLDAWLKTFGEVISRQQPGETYPPEVRQRLIYVLSVTQSASSQGQNYLIAPMSTTLLKSGSFGVAHPYNPENIFSHQPAKYLRRADHDILGAFHLLRRRSAGFSVDRLHLGADPMFATVLAMILETGRCRWQEVSGPVLMAGPRRPGSFRWEALPDGRQLLCFSVQGADEKVSGTARCDAILPLSPPHYVDVGAGLVGPLDLGLPDAAAAGLVEMPALPIDQATLFAAELEKRLANTDIQKLVPLPETPDETEVRAVTPVPMLHLRLGTVRLKDQYGYYIRDHRFRGAFELPLAEFSFDYGGSHLPYNSTAKAIPHREGRNLILMPRHTSLEATAISRLLEHGLTPIGKSILRADSNLAADFLIATPDTLSPAQAVSGLDDPDAFVAFEQTVVPQLRAEGWQITYSKDYPYRVVEADGEAWWADIGESSGIDWFSFELGIEYAGQRINLVPQFLDILSKLPPALSALTISDAPEATETFINYLSKLKLFHRLPDGGLLPLPSTRLAPIIKGLLDLIGPRDTILRDGRIKLHRAEAPALASLAQRLGTGIAWEVGAEKLMDLGRKLGHGAALKPVVPPDNFRAVLRPYQTIGLSWLDFLRETGFGGVLADDMGLGKTIQALAFLAREKAEGRLERPSLIIAPTSVLPNWQAESARFAPSLTVLNLRGLDRKQRFGDIGRHDLILTTYPLLLRDHEVLLDQEFHAVVLDEAQAIKNARANVAGLAHRIKAHHRFALTGTPLENNLGEVWSLFEFLSPGLLGDEKTFRRLFRTPIEKHGDAAAQSFLTSRLKPFILRRTKQEVASELPPKTEIVERIRLEGAQRDLYETVRSLMHEKVRQEIARKGLAKSHIVFLDALLKLRQICCDPRLLKIKDARKVKQSAKLERLLEMIPEMIGEGRKILLFSQFTSMLDLIVPELTALNIPYVTLTGDTIDRETPVRTFQSGDVPIFLLSLKAGGTGLNLTAADTVIHYDPWWNPAVENQATDRAHRIGQTKPVFVYKLIVEEGIEEAIEILKARKAALADALFAGVSKSVMDLTEKDISALFAPLSKRAK